MALDAKLAASIKLVGFDVDGVLTDGGIYLGATESAGRLELKRYDIQDGLGMHLLQSAGIRVVIVTGRESESVRLRAEELGVDDCVQNKDARKLPAFAKLLRKHGVGSAEAAFVGDDLPDLAILRDVGLPVAVANAVAEVKAECKVQLTRAGGQGAVREFAELLLRARGEWTDVAERYVRERARATSEGSA